LTFDQQKSNNVSILFTVSKWRMLKLFAKIFCWFAILFTHRRPSLITIHLFWHTFNCFCQKSKNLGKRTERKKCFVCNAVRVLALFPPTVMHYSDQLISDKRSVASLAAKFKTESHCSSFCPFFWSIQFYIIFLFTTFSGLIDLYTHLKEPRYFFEASENKYFFSIICCI
jgi:hypothetical protein